MYTLACYLYFAHLGTSPERFGTIFGHSRKTSRPHATSKEANTKERRVNQTREQQQKLENKGNTIDAYAKARKHNQNVGTHGQEKRL